MLGWIRYLDAKAQTAFGAALLAFALAWYAIDQYQVVQARHWPSVQGRVIESTSVRRGARGGGYSYLPRIRYRYEAAGQSFTGDRIWLARDERFGEDRIAGFLAAYPVDGPVTVRFDPADPARSALLIEGETAAPAILALFGFLIVGWGLYRLRKKKLADPARR